MQVCRQVFVASVSEVERVAEILQRQSQGRIPLIDLKALKPTTHTL